MWTALLHGVADAFAPAERRAMLLSLVGAVALLAALWVGGSAALFGLHLSGFTWLDRAIDLLGSLAGLFLAWLLFPTASMLVLSFFLDGIVAEIERRHYPDLPPPRRIGLGQSLGSALRLTLLALVLNLVVLPLYFLPVANVIVFYGINGYLVGREYFESIAFRRLDTRDVRALWHRHRMALIVAGMVIAFLLSVPVVNLVAPMIGLAFMLHLVEGLRRRAATA